VARAGADPDVAVLLVTGVPGSFCASPFALVRTKKLMLDGSGAPLRAHVHATRTALAECFASADHEEGVAAFLERRPARLTGH
jgi:enoyl-CoA hydratase/carnithine racemase